jgi:dTDP-4-dehydrorhamnose reductase
MTENILLIGCNGQLGWECQRTLSPFGQLTCLDYPQINLQEPQTLPGLIRDIKPSFIVNAAAYTNVDKAESEPEIAKRINADAPGIMAKTARSIGAAFFHFSTDYVFDGTKGQDYFESDPPNPLNEYGKSKLLGEQQVLANNTSAIIFRTSWVYSSRASSFVRKAIDWSHKQEIVKIVTDQIGSPTWARLLAEVTAILISRASQSRQDWMNEKGGLYHLAGLGSSNRFEVAKLALELDPDKENQLCKSLQGALTSDFPTPARRPLNTGLNCDLFEKTFNLKLPDWRLALKQALEK